jgi:hypothetical protein
MESMLERLDAALQEGWRDFTFERTAPEAIKETPLCAAGDQALHGVDVLGRPRLELEAQLHGRAALQQEERLPLLVARAVEGGEDDHEPDPALQAVDGHPLLVGVVVDPLLDDVRAVGRLAPDFGHGPMLGRDGDVQRPFHVGELVARQQATRLGVSDRLVEQARSEVALDAVEDRPVRGHDRDALVQRDVAIIKVAAVEDVELRHLAPRPVGGRHGQVDLGWVDVAKLVQVERGLVAKDTLDGLRPQRRLHVLVKSRARHERDPVNAVGDVISQPTAG